MSGQRSLNRKYLVINLISAALIIGVIFLLSKVSDRGFTELVNINAKNLTVLYKTSELKSFLSQETLTWNSMLHGKSQLPTFVLAADVVSSSAESLEKDLPESLRAPLKDFMKTQAEFTQLARQLRGGLNKVDLIEASQSADVLIQDSFSSLSQLSDSILLESGELQTLSIKQSNQSLRLALFVALILVTTSVVFFHFLLRSSVISPIIKLTKASLRVAEGDFSSMPTIKNQDEIGILSRNFNSMIISIQQNVENKDKMLKAAEEANRAKSTFLANMSHELRTPMHGVLSYARFGQQKIETASKEKLKSYFDEIYESGSRLMSLLNDLLDLAKLESGKISYVMGEADLGDLASTVVGQLRAFAVEKGLRLESRTNSAALVGSFDSERILQVLSNLVSNAIKFSDKNTLVLIDLTTKEDLLIFRVINHGVGIPEAELDSIFDKFVQSSKTKTGAGGTGLGLTICKEIIQQHGGKIWASSTNGETIFTVEIPRVAQISRPMAA